MFEEYGPAAFTVTINDKWGNIKDHQIQVSATDTPGTFTMSVGKDGDPLHPVATLTIDDDGNILTSQFTNKFGSRDWLSIEGSFGTVPPGGGISSAGNPAGTEGSWSAGGAEPFPPRQDQKRAHA
jgi:hypothetical protein